MSEVSIQALSPERVVTAVLRQLNQEQTEDAIASFAADFRFKDHGIGLEFADKEARSDSTIQSHGQTGQFSRPTPGIVKVGPFRIAITLNGSGSFPVRRAIG